LADKYIESKGLDRTKGLGDFVENVGKETDSMLKREAQKDNTPSPMQVYADPGNPTSQGGRAMSDGNIASQVQVRPFSEYFQEAMNGF